ncbi:Histone deacetylase HDT1 [Heracleum sosnowskyi]|uniref:Histone deacetylase HDT1 n=1 Tax=Heracleum sosnowskyi TaxID=360622 RepID=A0AAD8IP84_9APIA|nr:Histone deacetylase HDT1 [Heracleum sosnowskyi]
MEFWAVEVKAGEPFKVELHEKRALHLSQACVGEVEKGSSESIYLFVKVKGKKLALATLNSEKLPQQTFDLVFDKTFELSHTWKNGSVFFHGYTADNDIPDHEDSSDSDSDEDIPVIVPNGGPASEVKQEDSKVNASKNSAAGKQKAMIVESKQDSSSEDSDDSSDDDATSSEDDVKVSAGKDSAAGKQKVKMVEPKKDASSEDNDVSSDDDDDATSSEDDPKVSAGKDASAGKQKLKIVEPKNDASSEDVADSSDDDAMSEDDSEDNEENKSASDEDSDSDKDEVTPVQVKSSKKRASVSASKKHVPEKKAKLITPPKTDGKKSSVHVATPYPSKQAGKIPANKPIQVTPKTEGSHPCKSCKKIFKSETDCKELGTKVEEECYESKESEAH